MWVLCVFLKRLFSQGLIKASVSRNHRTRHPAQARPQRWPLPCYCPAAPPTPVHLLSRKDTDLPDSTSQTNPGRGLTKPFLKNLLSSSVILLRARSYRCLHSPLARHGLLVDKSWLVFTFQGCPGQRVALLSLALTLGSLGVRAAVNVRVCVCEAHKHSVHNPGVRNNLKQAGGYR